MNRYTINRWADRIVILGPGDELLTIPNHDLGRMAETLKSLDAEVSLFDRDIGKGSRG